MNIRRPPEMTLECSDLREVLDASAEGIVVARAIRNWRGSLVDFEFQFINSKGADILDRPAAEIVGRKVLELLGPEQGQPCLDRYTKVYQTGEPLDVDAPYELDGSPFWLRVRIRKVKGGVVVFFQDISLEKQVGVDKHAFEFLKESLIQTPSASFWIKNLDGVYTFANRGMRELMRMRSWQIVGKRDVDLFPTKLSAEFERTDREVMEKRAPISLVQRVPVEGKIKIFVTKKFPIFATDGSLNSIGGLSTEATMTLDLESDDLIPERNSTDRRSSSPL